MADEVESYDDELLFDDGDDADAPTPHLQLGTGTPLATSTFHAQLQASGAAFGDDDGDEWDADFDLDDFSGDLVQPSASPSSEAASETPTSDTGGFLPIPKRSALTSSATDPVRLASFSKSTSLRARFSQQGGTDARRKSALSPVRDMDGGGSRVSPLRLGALSNNLSKLTPPTGGKGMRKSMSMSLSGGGVRTGKNTPTNVLQGQTRDILTRVERLNARPQLEWANEPLQSRVLLAHGNVDAHSTDVNALVSEAMAAHEDQDEGRAAQGYFAAARMFRDDGDLDRALVEFEHAHQAVRRHRLAQNAARKFSSLRRVRAKLRVDEKHDEPTTTTTTTDGAEGITTTTTATDTDAAPTTTEGGAEGAKDKLALKDGDKGAKQSLSESAFADEITCLYELGVTARAKGDMEAAGRFLNQANTLAQDEGVIAFYPLISYELGRAQLATQPISACFHFFQLLELLLGKEGKKEERKGSADVGVDDHAHAAVAAAVAVTEGGSGHGNGEVSPGRPSPRIDGDAVVCRVHWLSMSDVLQNASRALMALDLYVVAQDAATLAQQCAEHVDTDEGRAQVAAAKALAETVEREEEVYIKQQAAEMVKMMNPVDDDDEEEEDWDDEFGINDDQDLASGMQTPRAYVEMKSRLFGQANSPSKRDMMLVPVRFRYPRGGSGMSSDGDDLPLAPALFSLTLPGGEQAMEEETMMSWLQTLVPTAATRAREAAAHSASPGPAVPGSPGSPGKRAGGEEVEPTCLEDLKHRVQYADKFSVAWAQEYLRFTSQVVRLQNTELAKLSLISFFSELRRFPRRLEGDVDEDESRTQIVLFNLTLEMVRMAAKVWGVSEDNNFREIVDSVFRFGPMDSDVLNLVYMERLAHKYGEITRSVAARIIPTLVATYEHAAATQVKLGETPAENVAAAAAADSDDGGSDAGSDDNEHASGAAHVASGASAAAGAALGSGGSSGSGTRSKRVPAVALRWQPSYVQALALSDLHLFLHDFSPLTGTLQEELPSPREDEDSRVDKEMPVISPMENILCIDPSYRMQLLQDLYGTLPRFSYIKAKAAFALGHYMMHDEGDTNAAEELFFEALYILSRCDGLFPGDSPLMSELGAQLLLHFSAVLISNDKFPYSVACFESVIANARFRKKDVNALYRRVADVCAQNNDLRRAIMYYGQVMQSCEENDRISEYVHVAEIIGGLHLERADFPMAVSTIDAAKEVVKRTTNAYLKKMLLYRLNMKQAHVFIDSNELGSAVELLESMHRGDLPVGKKRNVLGTLARVYLEKWWFDDCKFALDSIDELGGARRSTTDTLSLTGEDTSHAMDDRETLAIVFYRAGEFADALLLLDEIISDCLENKLRVLGRYFYLRGKVLRALCMSEERLSFPTSLEPRYLDPDADDLGLSSMSGGGGGGSGDRGHGGSFDSAAELRRRNRRRSSGSQDGGGGSSSGGEHSPKSARARARRSTGSTMGVRGGKAGRGRPIAGRGARSERDMHARRRRVQIQVDERKKRRTAQPRALYNSATDLLQACVSTFQRALDYFRAVGDSVYGAKTASAMAEVYLARLFVPVGLFGHPLEDWAVLPHVDKKHHGPTPTMTSGSLRHKKKAKKNATKAHHKDKHIALETIEEMASFGLETACETLDPMAMLSSYVNMAELRVLQDRKEAGMHYWKEARDMFVDLFLDGHRIPCMEGVSTTVARKLLAILQRLVRYMYLLDGQLVNRSVVLFDALVQCQRDAARIQRKAPTNHVSEERLQQAMEAVRKMELSKHHDGYQTIQVGRRDYAAGTPRLNQLFQEDGGSSSSGGGSGSSGAGNSGGEETDGASPVGRASGRSTPGSPMGGRHNSLSITNPSQLLWSYLYRAAVGLRRYSNNQMTREELTQRNRSVLRSMRITMQYIRDSSAQLSFEETAFDAMVARDPDVLRVVYCCLVGDVLLFYVPATRESRLQRFGGRQENPVLDRVGFDAVADDVLEQASTSLDGESMAWLRGVVVGSADDATAAGESPTSPTTTQNGKISVLQVRNDKMEDYMRRHLFLEPDKLVPSVDVVTSLAKSIRSSSSDASPTADATGASARRSSAGMGDLAERGRRAFHRRAPSESVLSMKKKGLLGFGGGLAINLDGLPQTTPYPVVFVASPVMQAFPWERMLGSGDLLIVRALSLQAHVHVRVCARSAGKRSRANSRTNGSGGSGGDDAVQRIPQFFAAYHGDETKKNWYADDVARRVWVADEMQFAMHASMEHRPVKYGTRRLAGLPFHTPVVRVGKKVTSYRKYKEFLHFISIEDLDVDALGALREQLRAERVNIFLLSYADLLEQGDTVHLLLSHLAPMCTVWFVPHDDAKRVVKTLKHLEEACAKKAWGDPAQFALSVLVYLQQEKKIPVAVFHPPLVAGQ